MWVVLRKGLHDQCCPKQNAAEATALAATAAEPQGSSPVLHTNLYDYCNAHKFHGVLSSLVMQLTYVAQISALAHATHK